MKTVCPAGYHHHGFVATHALGHMMSIYIAPILFVGFEHYVCRGSLTTICIYLYIYVYLCHGSLMITYLYTYLYTCLCISTYICSSFWV